MTKLVRPLSSVTKASWISRSVRVDGVDVRTVTAESLLRQIGIVLQDTYLFNTTVMENIRFGRPEATDDQVFAAAKLAHADTFIERLPDKYQTARAIASSWR